MSEAEHDADVWLRYAQEDLEQARIILDQPTFTPRHVAWMAQQAAEKAIKAVLVLHSITFPRTHDLDLLFALLPKTSRTRVADADLSRLSAYAVDARYPGDWPPISPEQAGSAVEDAGRVVTAADQDLGRRK